MTRGRFVVLLVLAAVATATSIASGRLGVVRDRSERVSTGEPAATPTPLHFPARLRHASAVPRVVGLARRQAERRLARAGLGWCWEEPPLPADFVYAQTIPPQLQRPEYPRVVVLVPTSAKPARPSGSPRAGNDCLGAVNRLVAAARGA